MNNCNVNRKYICELEFTISQKEKRYFQIFRHYVVTLYFISWKMSDTKYIKQKGNKNLRDNINIKVKKTHLYKKAKIPNSKNNS